MENKKNKNRIVCTALLGTVQVANIAKDGITITNSVDRTSDFIKTMVEYLEHHGTQEIKVNGELKYEISLKRLN